MNIITVIPLSRAKLAAELSYFTSADIPLGAIVSVPLRSKSIHAIVTESRRAEDEKIDIKNAPFEIRKLSKVKAAVFFPAAFVDACKILAAYYATTVGAVIDSLVSGVLLENAAKISPPLPKQPSFMSSPLPKDETFAIQGDDADRLSSMASRSSLLWKKASRAIFLN
jgi:primosomal protein N'